MIRKERINFYIKRPQTAIISIPDVSYRELAKLTGINYSLLQKVFTGKRLLPEKTAIEWRHKFIKLIKS